jgi:hypothetical protein
VIPREGPAALLAAYLRPAPPPDGAEGGGRGALGTPLGLDLSRCILDGRTA